MKTRKYRIITLTADILLIGVTYALIFLALHKNDGVRENVIVLAGMLFVWISVSLANSKINRGKIRNMNTLFVRVLVSNFLIVVIMAILLKLFKHSYPVEPVVLGTAMVATIFELFGGGLYLSYRRADIQNQDESDNQEQSESLTEEELLQSANGHRYDDTDISGIDSDVVTAIENECGHELSEAILRLAGNQLAGKTAVLSTTTIFNVAGLPSSGYNYIINLRRINDIKKLDLFLDAVNRKLGYNGYFLCCVETKDQRKNQYLKRYPPVINYLFYTIDFLIKRVLPKFRPTRGIYNFLTKGENAVISRAEALGRLSRAGFRIKKESIIENLLCIEAKKKTDPLPQNDNVFSPLIALRRVGKDGEMIKVFKLRTMHPYSEYIQDYVYSLYELRDGGKFKNDFRITSWGAFCRKTWLDEFPMFINVIRGEMKLFGIRPLSRHYFNLYSDELKERRVRYKPGLIPPFYADMPSNLDEIQASEKRYLDAYDKRPFMTDFRYFFVSFKNIMFKHARSR